MCNITITGSVSIYATSGATNIFTIILYLCKNLHDDMHKTQLFFVETSVKYIVCCVAAFHIHTGKTMMKFIKRCSNLFKKKIPDDAIRQWAKIEYKCDSEFAYNHMKEYGVAPSIGVNS